jgi:parvulin-like peptidyl-prolyl isomerase
MKKEILYIIIAGSLFCSNTFAQQPVNVQALLQEFSNTKNDSVFISKHSALPYQPMETDKSKPYDTSDALIKELFANGVGHVTGPFKKGNTVNYFKIVSFDSTYKARIGNILIQYGNYRTDSAAHELARDILKELKSGKDFNAFCHLYSDDHNQNRDCDIGWLFVTNMVYPVAKAVVNHKKGNVFIVKSQNGYHVIKMLENPVFDKMKVQFVKLAVKTN